VSRRILRPGGILSCQVDVRDHYQTDEAKLADHLRYSRWVWNAMTWNRGGFTNRLRYSEWLRLFDGVGLRVRTLIPHSSPVLGDEYMRRPDLQRLPVDDVVITSFKAVLVR
jgi:hypothetical protein